MLHNRRWGFGDSLCSAFGNTLRLETRCYLPRDSSSIPRSRRFRWTSECFQWLSGADFVDLFPVVAVLLGQSLMVVAVPPEYPLLESHRVCCSFLTCICWAKKGLARPSGIWLGGGHFGSDGSEDPAFCVFLLLHPTTARAATTGKRYLWGERIFIGWVLGSLGVVDFSIGATSQ